MTTNSPYDTETNPDLPDETPDERDSQAEVLAAGQVRPTDDPVDAEADVVRVEAARFDDLPPLPSFDIDAALAAVSSLDAVLTEQEAEQARLAALEAARQEQIEAEQRAEQERIRWIESYDFPRPPLTALRRGSLASILPALLLMGTGAYLTFALTLSATPPSGGLVALLVGGAVGLTFLANWLASGRWARGSLFAGLLLIAGGALPFVAELPVWDVLGLVSERTWPLVGVALGMALFLAGVLARPSSGRVAAGGLGISAASAFALATNAGAVCPCVGATITQVWPGIFAVVAVLAALPLLFRRA
jgi:hypothetical protein